MDCLQSGFGTAYPRHLRSLYGDVIGAWADSRVFKDGRWIFESADPALRSIHYAAGGHFYAIGEAIDV